MHWLWLSGALQISRCFTYWLLNQIQMAASPTLSGISGEVLQNCNRMHLQRSLKVCAETDASLTKSLTSAEKFLREVPTFQDCFSRALACFSTLRGENLQQKQEQKRVSDAVNVACYNLFPYKFPRECDAGWTLTFLTLPSQMVHLQEMQQQLRREESRIGLGIDTNFTVRFDFDSHARDSILIRFNIDSFGHVSDTAHGKFQEVSW